MKRTLFAYILLTLPTITMADGLPVTANAVFTFNGEEITISRVSTLENATSPCASPCLSPMSAAPGVVTVGELDVIGFLSAQVQSGDGLLVDARLPQDRAQGFIPASVNIPSATLSATNPYRDDILRALGAQQFQGVLSFTDALSLVIYDAGPATKDAPDLILDLLAAGYPADKIAYYRGGALVWSTLGLSTTVTAQ